MIEVITETGARVMVPLWKFPQLCSDEVSCKKDAIQAEADAKAAREKAEKMAEDARVAALVAEGKALDKPFDLAKAEVVG
jgi:hypothetical protein